MQTTSRASTASESGIDSEVTTEVSRQYAGGHLVFAWVAALTSAWFFLPAHAWQIALLAICCGFLSVASAFLAARSAGTQRYRVTAVLSGILPFTLIPTLREGLSSPDWAVTVITLTVSLVTVGIMLFAIDGLSTQTSRSRWVRALGFVTLILSTFLAAISGLLSQISHDYWLGVHLIAVPAFVVFFWFLAVRIPRLRWLLIAIMLGVALPVVALSNLSSFAFLGGIGFVLYIILQTSFVFAAERFLRVT